MRCLRARHFLTFGFGMIWISGCQPVAWDVMPCATCAHWDQRPESLDPRILQTTSCPPAVHDLAAAFSKHCWYDTKSLKGWKVTCPLRHSGQSGESQWASLIKFQSFTRFTFSTFWRHWSMNISSPHKHGPEQSFSKWCTHLWRPPCQTSTAFCEKTSMGPCKPNLQLLK